VTSKRALLRQQRQWAKARSLKPDTRGYLGSIEENLFQPLSATARTGFNRGSGGEHEDHGKRPAKMRALHSSAVLAVNVFDYWIDKDAEALRRALGIGPVIQSFGFEAQFPTGLTGNPPNLDLALELESGNVVGIECKFTEWLTPKRRSRPPFKEKYFEGGAELWRRNGLPRSQALASDLMSGAQTFRYLDAAQLLKHALGLATQRTGRFALIYLYYDLPCEASRIHRAELGRFAEQAGAELAFTSMTYQDLHAALSSSGDVEPRYLDYLGSRYFQ
jgi:hypothetical protein